MSVDITALLRRIEKNGIDNFKRDRYAGFFDRYVKDCSDIYSGLRSALTGEGLSNEALYKEISDEFVSVFFSEYELIKKKSGKDQFMIDHNMLMVVYVLPGIVSLKEDWCMPFCDALASSWNSVFTRYKISVGSFEDINGSFKRKLCYITTAVCSSLDKPEDCYELRLLKDYRDNILSRQEGGMEMIDRYYDVAPTIVKRINKRPDKDAYYRTIYDDFIKPCIGYIENGSYAECRATYTEMVNTLKNRYMGNK